MTDRIVIFAMLGLVAQPSAARAETTRLALAQAYQLALDRNSDLALARETVVQARIARKRAWSGLLPVLSTAASYTRNQYEAELDPRLFDPTSTAPPIVIQAQDALNASVKLHQPILAPSAIVKLIGEGTKRDVARLDFKRTKQELLKLVANAYFELLSAQDAIQIAEQTLRDRVAHLHKEKVLFDNGAATETAVTQAEIDLADAERQRLDARAARDLAIEAMHVLCKLDGTVVAVDPSDPPAALPDEETLLTAALARRPDLRAARRLSADRNIVKWRARTKFLPEIAADLSGSWSNAAGFTGQNLLWIGVITGTWTLFDGGARYADSLDGDSQVRQLTLQERRIRDQVTTEVRRGLVEARSARARWELAQREAKLARRNEALVRARFDVGAATPLELSDAGSRRLANEVGEIRSKNALRLALVALDVAAGRDLVR
ncbi:MAG: TolC family protein [Proteobacteria bacterium]|nr:TolC family protein [Pseudomonadota bacterium]